MIVAIEVLRIFYHMNNIEIQGLQSSFRLLSFPLHAFIINTNFLHILSQRILMSPKTEDVNKKRKILLECLSNAQASAHRALGIV